MSGRKFKEMQRGSAAMRAERGMPERFCCEKATANTPASPPCPMAAWACYTTAGDQPHFTTVTPGDIQLGEKLEMMPQASVLTRTRGRIGVTD